MTDTAEYGTHGFQQPRDPMPLPGRIYLLVLTLRLSWLLWLSLATAAACSAVVNVLLIQGNWEDITLDHLFSVQSISIGAGVASTVFAATLIRDSMKGRGAGRVWQELGGYMYIRHYDWGALPFIIASDGQRFSRWALWNNQLFRIAVISLPVAMALAVVSLGWPLIIAAAVLLLFVAIRFTLILWRPEPEFRDVS